MNRDDVIKALECCSNERNLCAECPVDKQLLDACVCGSFVMGQALQLIGGLEQIIFELEKRLKECENGYFQTLALERAKVKELTEKVVQLLSQVDCDEAEITLLRKHIESLAETIEKQEQEIYSAKADTVRKMQEALRERIKGVYLDEGEMCAIIDEVAGKILGGKVDEKCD